MGERKSEKPDIIVRGRDTYLSVWISSIVKISITRKSSDGYERVDSYAIPLDYLVFKILDKSRDVLKRYCEFVDALQD